MTTTKRKKEATEKNALPEEPPATSQNIEVPENAVYIGTQPVMNYVLNCLTRFNSGSKKIIVKARGRAICRAVDTVEVLRRSFVKDVALQSIAICTEEVTREEGRKANVSAVEITLTKP